MFDRRRNRCFALLLLALLAAIFAGCKTSPQDSADRNALTKITLQLDWYPQPEHGGYRNALVRGYYHSLTGGLYTRQNPNAQEIPWHNSTAVSDFLNYFAGMTSNFPEPCS